MLSLELLGELITFPVETVTQETIIEIIPHPPAKVPDKLSSFMVNEVSHEPVRDDRFFVPKKTYKQFFDEREGRAVRVSTWSREVAELREFFNGCNLPATYRLGVHYINDVRLFIQSHIETLISNDGNRYFMPYMERLIELKRNLA